MKNFILATALFCSSLVHAAEIKLVDENVWFWGSGFASLFTSFQMDKTTGQGFVSIVVYEEPDYLGGRFPQRSPRLAYSNRVKVEGLKLVNDKVIFESAEGAVECGTMGISRWTKKPVLRLSGNCYVSGRVNGYWTERNVVVNFKTK